MGGGLKTPLPHATEPIFDSVLIKVHANLGYFWVLSSWKFVTWLPNNEINQNITLYSCFWHYSFFHILNLGYFGLYLAIFGYPGFLPIFHSYLKLKYIKLEHFKPILGFQFSPEFHFSPIWVIFGFLWPFLGTQCSQIFVPWVLNIEIHLDVLFYTCFGCYSCLHNLIWSLTGQLGPFWAVFGYFWVPQVTNIFTIAT